MLEPLTQFICDSCGEIINRPENGWIEWLVYEDPGKGLVCGKFRICHHRSASPYLSGCYNHTKNIGCADMHMDAIIASEKKIAKKTMAAKLLRKAEFQEVPVADVKEYLMFINRLYTPFYDEARLYFNKARANGDLSSNWDELTDSRNLRRIIEEYAVWL